jgi:hypothetical protein
MATLDEERDELRAAVRQFQDELFKAFMPLLVWLAERLDREFKPRWQALVDADRATRADTSQQ